VPGERVLAVETVKIGFGFRVPVMALTMQVGKAVEMLAGLLVMAQVPSFGLKPLPETVTDVVSGA
jgi:hypothetical protein